VIDLNVFKDFFRTTFNEEPKLFRAPGRVNIIGEHTDYNGGFVLPFPIEQAIYFAVSTRQDNEFHIYARDLNDHVVISNEKIENLPDWARYFLSALKVLWIDQHQFKGMNLVTQGDIPFGAGMSSSSALTCGFIYAIARLNDLPITKRDTVFLASRAENDTGLDGGKMDQFTICMGVKDKALKIDCHDYSYEIVNVDTHNASWVLFNTNVAHNLAETEYNDRRRDCDQGLAIIMEKDKAITHFRDLSEKIINTHKNNITPIQHDRLNHYVNENERLSKMIKALQTHNLNEAGDLLYGSHQSLSDLYEVSCDQLDYIVSYLNETEYTYGARMMGGGFGGCVIALIKEPMPDFEDLKNKYKTEFDLEMGIIPVISGDGMGEI
jgi:galactokinase